MNLYWNYDSIPGLQGLSAEQHRRLKEKGQRASWRMPVMWVANGLLLACTSSECSCPSAFQPSLIRSW